MRSGRILGFLEVSAFRTSALVGLVAVLGPQCSSKGTDDVDLFRQYMTERTLIATGVGDVNEEGCGTPQAPVSGGAALRYEVTNRDGKVRVTDLVGGCVLDARVEGSVVNADNQECSFSDGAALRQLGVTSRLYTVFQLDAGKKTIISRAVTVSTVTTGVSRSCSVAEERIVESPDE